MASSIQTNRTPIQRAERDRWMKVFDAESARLPIACEKQSVDEARARRKRELAATFRLHGTFATVAQRKVVRGTHAPAGSGTQTSR
jgi:hypothetical protein